MNPLRRCTGSVTGDLRRTMRTAWEKDDLEERTEYRDLDDGSGANMNREVPRNRACHQKNQSGAKNAAINSASHRVSKQQPLHRPTRRRGQGQGRSDTIATVEPPPPPPLPPPPPPSFDPSWRAIFAEEYGRLYFYNLDTGETTWEPPPQSQGANGISSPLSVVNRCGTVTVRSRSSVILSKGGKVQYQPGCRAISSRSQRGTHPAGVQSCGVNKLDTTGEVDDKKIGMRTEPGVRSSIHRASARAVKRLEGTFSGTEDEADQRARRMLTEKGGSEMKRALRSKQRNSVRCPEDTKSLPTKRGQTLMSEMAPASQAKRVASSLLQAEDWLANNETDGERGQRRRHRASVSEQPIKNPDVSRRTRGTLRTSMDPLDDPIEGVDARQKVDIPGYDLPGATTARLRGKAAAVLGAIKARRREEREMTGRPEITSLGRSKQRSVDDLFLFRRTVEAARRRKQDERETHENSMMTGRPETCKRSSVLVERMRRDGSRVRLSTSQRLHSKASEQRRRQEELQMRVEAAIRRRANPDISTRSRSLPRERCDVARRLYEQAILSREEALEREHLARKPPKGFTFHPEIHQRSARLAQRRRNRWASVGLDASRTGGDGAAVQEFLLAEGTLYDRRRQERQSRQEELALRRQAPTVNPHSRRLLRDAERMGRSVGTQSEEGRSRASEAATDAEQHNFRPRLVALDTSKKMLESRYGRDAIPSMQQRAKERELELLERRRAQSVEEDKENRNFIARRTARPSSESASPEHPLGGDIYERTTEYVKKNESRRASQRKALLAQELAGCTFAPELPAKSRGRSSHDQAAVPTVVSGWLSSPPAETSGEDERPVHAEDGRTDSSVGPGGRSNGNDSALSLKLVRGGQPVGQRGRPSATTIRPGRVFSPLPPPPPLPLPPPPTTTIGGVSEEEERPAGWNSNTCDGSVGSGEVGLDSRRRGTRRASEGSKSSSGLRGHRQEEGEKERVYMQSSDDDSDNGDEQEYLVHRNDTAVVGAVASCAGEGARTGAETGSRGRGTLPRNWTAFTSPEGWNYFYNEETGVVQWKQPAS